MSIVEIAKAMEQFKDVPGVYNALKQEMHNLIGVNTDLTGYEVATGIKSKIDCIRQYKFRTGLSLIQAKNNCEEFFQSNGLKFNAKDSYVQ